jgi:putative tricarboxylic transport membrane protein
MRKTFTFILAMALSLVFVGAAVAADWPEKTVTLIYHSKPGSGGDIFLRSLAKPMEEFLGQAVIVDNKPGAAGMNAWKPASEAKDNHTFLGVSSTSITSPILNKLPITYQTFKPVAMMFVDPMILFVSSESPWKTLDDFIKDAKANPGKFNIAGGVPGELGYVAAMLLMDSAGVKFNIVPFESGADATVSVMGGHIHGAVGEYGEAVTQVEAGKVRVLVGFNPVEGTGIKTVQDYGYNFEVEKFRGILAPKSCPDEIIAKMIQACEHALKDPKFKTYYGKMKLVPTFKPKEKFTKVMEEQDKQIRATMKGM